MSKILRALRGGAWYSTHVHCWLHRRNEFPPVHRNINYGFRVVRVPRTPLVKKGDRKDGK